MSLDSGRSETHIVCPQCWKIVPFDVGKCEECDADLTWLGEANLSRGAEHSRGALFGWAARSGGQVGAQLPAPDGRPLPIEVLHPRNIPIREVGGELSLGRLRQSGLNHCELGHCAVDGVHALLKATMADDGSCWLVDNGAATGTFVNGRSVIAARLQGGDLVQVGPFAFIYNASDGLLAPIDAIRGLAVRLERISLRGDIGKMLLSDVSLDIAAGQFLALRGDSGSGKSSLMKVLVRAHDLRAAGQVLIDQAPVESDLAGFRSKLGYVPQFDTAHAELTPRQVLFHRALLRALPINSLGDAVERTLDEVDLKQDRRDTRVEYLSGGEKKRLAIATELISEPRLFLLDEPDSGLDREARISLLRLLRSLSLRGSTVVLITHHEEYKELADKAVQMADGRIKPRIDPQTERLDARSHETKAQLPPLAGGPDTIVRDRHFSPVAGTLQMLALLRRDCRLAISDKKTRLLMPLVAFPLAFGFAVAIAVGSMDHSMLGFLSILACIWMGASTSHLAIANERAVYEQERLLFLRIGAYTLSKAIAYSAIAAAQCLVFTCVLNFVRTALFAKMHGLEEEMLFGWGWAALFLVLAGVTAANIGSLLSAMARSNLKLAGLLLPLFMIAQMLFSVLVAGKGDDSLHVAYGEFTLHRCEGADGCARRAERWLPADPHSKPQTTSVWLCDACNTDRNRTLNLEGDRKANQSRPNWIAVAASYLTITRYADIGLRGFAYSKDDYDKFHQGFVGGTTLLGSSSHAAYTHWRMEAVATLVLMNLLALAGVAGMLAWQSAGTAGRLKSKSYFVFNQLRKAIGIVARIANRPLNTAA